MFEQELYTAAPVESSQEGDLFHKYEIRNWEFGPRLYKILAVSAIFNVLALLIVAQSDLLTRKGCESPWVGSVCQVLDMAYVGTMLYGTERDYIDQEYEQVDLGDAEITFIDVSGETPPLSYPEGYFQIANPVQYEMLKQQAAADPTASYIAPMPTPTTGSGGLMASPPVYPKYNPKTVTGPIPDSPFADDTNSNTSASNKGKNKPGNKTPPANNANADQTVAENPNANTNPTLTSDPVPEVDINKLPMIDLGNSINALREKGQLNLESEFIVEGKGRLDQNGRFDPKTFRYKTKAGKDEATVNVVTESIEALNQAGYLGYIKGVIGKDLSFIFQQGAENLEATFQSDLDNDSMAKQRKTSLDFFIGLVKQRKQGENASQDDKDDLVLLEGIKTEVVGKTLKITFVVPKAIAHPMIQRKLAEQAAELKKPNGQANTRQNDNTAPK